MGCSKDFNNVILELSEEFCCLNVDLPGHGKTRGMDNLARYSMSETARGAIALLDELEIDKCSLVGYSMGGRLALYTILYFPHRFESGIIESASPGLKTKKEREERRKVDENRSQELENGKFPEFLSHWYGQPLFEFLRNSPQFEKMMARRLQNNPRELAKSLRYMGTGSQPSLWENLKENQIPLLLLVGENDVKFRAINAEMARCCRVANVAIAPNAGHNVHLENPPEWVRQVKQFLIDSSN